MEELLKLAKALQEVRAHNEFYYDNERSGILERQLAHAKEDICNTIGDKLEQIICEQVEKIKEQTI